jgi:DNA (cytosine-5)-methyltransferase 1
MSAYYNEIDPYAAQWLRNLIREGLIPPGEVDDRDIRLVKPGDLSGYDQCHFFAGIAGWSLALRLAGWPDDRPVWTGSCPCQPFSAAGKGQASGDERHLWPHWFELIRACRPSVIFGEQVEAAIGWGWLDLVHSDLEEEGYAVGAAVLPAAGVGAPHIRQRLWFVAESNDREQNWQTVNGGEELAEHGTPRWRGVSGVGNPECAGLEGHAGDGDEGDQPGWLGTQPPRPTSAPGWADLLWLPCTDGKSRPTQSGIFPLAHGIPARVAKLRAAGNAIVPQVAAEFIKAAL